VVDGVAGVRQPEGREEGAVQPHNEFRFHPQVVQIGCYWGEGGHTELYLLQGDTLAIVDTGVHDSPTKYLAPALATYGLTLGDVDLILNTHGHHDHTGGNGELVTVSGAKIWIHEADAQAAEDPDAQFDTYFVNRHVLVGQADRLEAARAAFKVNAGKSAKVDRKLVDGDVVGRVAFRSSTIRRISSAPSTGYWGWTSPRSRSGTTIGRSACPEIRCTSGLTSRPI
jgi:hypothetical protein